MLSALCLFASVTLADGVRARFDEIFEAANLPGLSACVVMPDGTQILMAKGFADQEGKQPMTPEHRFLSGSTGKTYFAALALLLQQEGVLSLDDKLKSFLGEETWYPRLPNGDDVTLRQLLRHQSGITEHLDDPRFAQELAKDASRTWKPEETLAFLLDTKPLFEAGKGWSYSDTNYILVAMAIEKRTSKVCYDLIQERFLNKRGLLATEPSIKRAYDRFANGNHANNLLLASGWMLVDGQMRLHPQVEWAGGGFVTNPRDLAVWIRSLMDGALSEGSLAQMKESVPAATGRGHAYGLGLMARPSALGTSYGHSGWFPGYVTDVQHFPDSKVTVCMMANTDDLRAFGTHFENVCVELAKAATGAQ